ncbi:hypothetical protein LINPERPRIM_LOCUS23938 [Linum perenne]
MRVQTRAMCGKAFFVLRSRSHVRICMGYVCMTFLSRAFGSGTWSWWGRWWEQGMRS